MILYPDDFVKKVEKEYSDWPEVVELARGQKYLLGTFLSQGARMGMTPEQIVESIASGDCESVRADAETATRRRLIHAEWIRIMLRGISSIGKGVPAPRWSKAPPSRRRSLPPEEPRADGVT